MRLRWSSRNSNTYPDGHFDIRGAFIFLFGMVVVVCLFKTAFAIDPDRSMSQYLRDKWGADKGFPRGPVYAITQTTDGYLWIGTEKGLVRFDGINFRIFDHTNTPTLPAGPVLGLAADNNGNLWIRMRSPNMLRYRDGALYDVQTDLKRNEQGITAMCQASNGELIIFAMINGLLRHNGEKFITIASMVNRPNFLVISMAETTGGDIWMGTRDSGLYRLHGDQAAAVTNGLPDTKINCLLADGDNNLWVGTDNGIVRWNGAELTKVGVPSTLSRTHPLTMIRDRDSNIWIGTDSHGLLRFNFKGVAAMEDDGLRAGRAVTTLFEDREGNLWIGTPQGLERLRDSAFTTYSIAEGLPSESNGPIFTDSQNRTWFAPSNGGLYWIRGRQIEQVTAHGLDKDVIYSIAGGNGELWIGRQRGGLTQLRYQGNSFTATTYSQPNGLAQNSVYAVYQSRDGSVWSGTLSGGVSRFNGGRFSTWTSADGLVSNTITAIAESSNGTMWFATPGGLSVMSKDQWRRYTTQDGLPSENVNCLLEDSGGTLWIGTGDGLAFLGSGRIQIPQKLPAALREQIFGLAEDKRGFFWIATANRVLHVKRDALLRGTLSDVGMREYGIADGLRSTEGVKRFRSVVADPLGRIWFSLNRGISVVDPSQVVNAAPAALVDIQSISADGKPIDLQSRILVPSIRQRLTFGFAGLSLSMPERVNFKFRLDGFDHDWNGPVSAREATYTNLGPGAYRFRVMASNSDGFWNGKEAVIPFEIEPLFWQTWWFRLIGILTLLVAILFFYRLRLRQVTRQMNLRFEERLSERMRIAQDLHDTLLQGCISASMQLHVAVDQLPDDSTARPKFGRVVQLMTQMIEEGRNAVRGLRSSPSNLTDLEQSFSRIPQEIALPENGDAIDFRVIVEGRPKDLHPILRDDVYRIGREALVNAFRHARATTIEIELEYAPAHLRILVRDDGSGIDPQVLRSGRDGHWGLTGMRERAERIGARLNVRSRAAAGTEVELSVPGHIAFLYQDSSRLMKLFTRLNLRNRASEDEKLMKRRQYEEEK